MVYLLVDCSISPQKTDLRYAKWLFTNKVPFGIVFTKVKSYATFVVYLWSIDYFRGVSILHCKQCSEETLLDASCNGEWVSVFIS